MKKLLRVLLVLKRWHRRRSRAAVARGSAVVITACYDRLGSFRCYEYKSCLIKFHLDNSIFLYTLTWRQAEKFKIIFLFEKDNGDRGVSPLLVPMNHQLL